MAGVEEHRWWLSGSSSGPRPASLSCIASPPRARYLPLPGLPLPTASTAKLHDHYILRSYSGRINYSKQQYAPASGGLLYCTCTVNINHFLIISCFGRQIQEDRCPARTTAQAALTEPERGSERCNAGDLHAALSMPDMSQDASVGRNNQPIPSEPIV